jgi:hypothetical protein
MGNKKSALGKAPKTVDPSSSIPPDGPLCHILLHWAEIPRRKDRKKQKKND